MQIRNMRNSSQAIEKRIQESKIPVVKKTQIDYKKVSSKFMQPTTQNRPGTTLKVSPRAGSIPVKGKFTG